MISLKIISIVSLYVYTLGLLFWLRGIPCSYSESSYLLPKKWQWLFSAWAFLSSVPFCFYWYSLGTAPAWMPISIALALCFVAATDQYKPPVKQYRVKNASVSRIKFFDKIKQLIASLNIKEMFKYGWAKPVHYIYSVYAITVTLIFCYMDSVYAFICVLACLAMAICIGSVTTGVYNKTTSLDVDNSAWIFFMELVMFSSLFIIVK